MTRRLSLVLMVVLMVASLAVGIDNLGRILANPDEGRYSEISREMAAAGDWVTPRLNGIKYFEKPPLQYWATAASFELFGVNEYSARLYTMLCGLATLLLVGFTAARLYDLEVGVASLVALMSSPYFMALGGIVTLDMGLTLWTTLTFCAFLLAQREGLGRRARRGWMLAAWAGIALAVLSKGLVGLVFPTAALGLHCLLRRDFSVLKRLEWGWGLALAAAIAVPWFVLVSRANPEFARFFFVHEHFQRFLTTTHRRTEPWWYFVPILAGGLLPWVFALPAALRAGWRHGGRDEGVDPMRFAILWSVFIVAFFSASGSKLPTYILPAVPPLGIVLGRYLVHAPTATLARLAAPNVLVAIVLAIAAWRMPVTARDAWTQGLYAAAQPYAYAAAAIFALLAVGAPALLWRGKRWAALLVVAIGMTLLIDCLEDAYEQLSPRQSGREVAFKMAAAVTPASRLYSVKTYDQTVPFYLGRTLTLVDYGDEFETGVLAEPGKTIDKLHEFPAQWLRPGDALAIMHPDAYERLRLQGLPMQVLHQDPRRVLVRKP